MGTTHFSGPVAIGAGSISTQTAAFTVTANDSGTTFVLGATSTPGAITLPAPAAGLRYKFIVGGAFDTADWVITATGAIMQGSVQEAGAQQSVTNATTVTLELAAEAVGDYIDLISDGTNWYVSGMTATAASVTAA